MSADKDITVLARPGDNLRSQKKSSGSDSGSESGGSNKPSTTPDRLESLFRDSKALEMEDPPVSPEWQQTQESIVFPWTLIPEDADPSTFDYSRLLEGNDPPASKSNDEQSDPADSPSSNGPVKGIPKISAGKRNYSLSSGLRYMPRLKGAPKFLEATEATLGSILREWGNILYLRIYGRAPSPSQTQFLKLIITFLVTMTRARGPATTLKYMKASNAYVLAFLSGNPLKDSWAFGTPVSLTVSGLPKWLPADLRKSLRQGQVLPYRWTISFMMSYKGLSAPIVDASLDTIQAPPCPFKDVEEFDEFHPGFMAWCFQFKVPWHKFNFRFPKPYKDIYNLPIFHDVSPFKEILTVGPNGSPSTAYSGMDAVAWCSKGDYNLVRYLRLTGNHMLLNGYYITLWEVQRTLIDCPTLDPASFAAAKIHVQTGPDRVSELRSVSSLWLGKLSLKPEAAGKVRVFAIVDYWTQCAFQPLHDAIFSVLDSLPTDATFRQGKAFQEFINRAPSRVYSYDLTAATDLIPLNLQTEVLSMFVGSEIAQAWSDLLVDRDFRVPSGTTYSGSSIRYTRGQPMGALSSWAMLALTHHFLVYTAATRAGLTNYTDYLVCGDDIVLSGEIVPAYYLDLCHELGIKISLPKSLISDKDLVERAKWELKGPAISFVSRVSVGTVDLSPLSLKDEITIFNLPSRAQSVLRLAERGQLKLGNSILPSLCKAGLCRFSDLDKLFKVFTSREMVDQVTDFLSPLLFPTPQNREVLGLGEDTIYPWIAVVLQRPSVLAYGEKLLGARAPIALVSQIKALCAELVAILWSRLMDSYEISVYNEAHIDLWIDTLLQSSFRYCAEGHIPAYGFRSVPTVVSQVVKGRILRDVARMDDILEKCQVPLTDAADVVRRGRVATGRKVIDQITHMVAAVVKLYELWLEAPSPEILNFMNCDPTDTFLRKSTILRGGSTITPPLDQRNPEDKSLVDVGSEGLVPQSSDNVTEPSLISLNKEVFPIPTYFDCAATIRNIEEITILQPEALECYRGDRYLKIGFPPYWVKRPTGFGGLSTSSRLRYPTPLEVLGLARPHLQALAGTIPGIEGMLDFHESRMHGQCLEGQGPPTRDQVLTVSNPFLIREGIETKLSLSPFGKAFNRALESIDQLRDIMDGEAEVGNVPPDTDTS